MYSVNTFVINISFDFEDDVIKSNTAHIVLSTEEHMALVNSGELPNQFALLVEPKIRFGHTAVIN